MTYTDEELERYVSDFIDWFDRSMILDNVRRECVVEFLPVFIDVYELGIFANRKKVMALRKLAMELPA